MNINRLFLCTEKASRQKVNGQQKKQVMTNIGFKLSTKERFPRTAVI